MPARDKFLNEITTFEGNIRKFFAGKTHNIEDIDDLTQETLCRIYESIHRFRGDSSLNTWIFSICRYVYFDFCRKDRIFSSHELPEIEIHENFEKIELALIVEKMPGHLRKVYGKYTRGLKVREIAWDLSIPEGTVKYYLYEIRKFLKTIYLPLRE